jgi:FixJ family two-component response regulator
MKYLRLRIAVIDDDVSVRKALKRLLGVANLDVDAFASGREFLASLPSKQPDCIVLDFDMPGMNAVDILRQLAREGMRAPTIVVSGHDGLQDHVQCLCAGAVAHLRKPFDAEELLEAIYRAVGAPSRQVREGLTCNPGDCQK